MLRERGIRRVGPYRVTQTMGSTVSACLATPFEIKGVNYQSHRPARPARTVLVTPWSSSNWASKMLFSRGRRGTALDNERLFDAMGAIEPVQRDA